MPILVRELKPFTCQFPYFGRAVRGSVDSAYATGSVGDLYAAKKSTAGLQGEAVRKSGDEVENILLTTSLHHAPSLFTSFNILPQILSHILSYYPPSLFCDSTFSFPQRYSSGPGHPLHFSPFSSNLPSLATLPRISIDAKNTPEAATIVASAPTLYSFPARGEGLNALQLGRWLVVFECPNLLGLFRGKEIFFLLGNGMYHGGRGAGMGEAER